MERERRSSNGMDILLAPENPLRKQNARFLCQVRFKNDLPEIPCDPKMLLPPLNPRALAAFSLTSMEKEMKRDMVFPQDIGIPINALDIERYSLPPSSKAGQLDPTDEILIAEGKDGAAAQLGRASTTRGDVSWLMRTKYITNDVSGVAKTRPPSGSSPSKDQERENAGGRDDVRSQIELIEASFEACRKPPQHPKNPQATPVRVLPVLPDEVLGARQFVLTTFDGDPVADSERTSRLSQEDVRRLEASSHVKSFKFSTPDGKMQNFATYMVPRQVPSAGENKDDGEGEIAVPASSLLLEYDWVREYDTKVTAETDKHTFLFRIAKDHVGYSDLNTRLMLRKRARSVGRRSDDIAGDDDAVFQRPEKFVLVAPPSTE